MRRFLWLAFASCLAALVGGPRAFVEAASPSADDVQLIAAVAARIFQEAMPHAEPVEGFEDAFALAQPGADWAWPPVVGIADTKIENAYATVQDWKPGFRPETIEDTDGLEVPVQWVDIPGFESRTSGAQDEAPSGTIRQPVIIIFQAYLDEIFCGSPEAAAATMGHELSHILLGHAGNVLPPGAIVFNALSRQQEAAADMLGVQLALRARFDYDGIVAGAIRKRQREITAAEENRQPAPCPYIATSHPDWNDRLAIYDEHRRELWKSLGAFSDGAHFLICEQYDLAEECFERVVAEFPDCYEAWANLGYARLMMYCDALEPEDLRAYEIGQLVLGGFYRQAGSLGVRDTLEQLWIDAEAALQRAVNLNPDLLVAKANLAAAYLVHPAGKQVGRAAELFDAVVAAVEQGRAEEGVDRLTYAALLVNAGVADMANGDRESATRLFERAREYFGAGDEADARSQAAGAIQYNLARLMAESNRAEDQRSAIDELEQYLASSSEVSAWWPLALEAYEKLCRQQGVVPKPAAALTDAKNVQLRLATRVTLADGRTLILNGATEQLQEMLGDAWSTPVARGRTAQRLRYHDLGLDLFCTDRVVSIRLVGQSAPALRLEASGPAGGSSREIRVGMAFDEVTSMLGRDGTSWDRRSGTTPSIVYNYFPRLGFGVRIGDRGQVTEIIVAQIPEESGT